MPTKKKSAKIKRPKHKKPKLGRNDVINLHDQCDVYEPKPNSGYCTKDTGKNYCRGCCSSLGIICCGQYMNRKGFHNSISFHQCGVCKEILCCSGS